MNKKNRLKQFFKAKKMGGLRHPLCIQSICYPMPFLLQRFLLCICIGSLIIAGGRLLKKGIDNAKIEEQQIEMLQQKIELKEEFRLPLAGVAMFFDAIEFDKELPILEAKIMPEYQSLYEENTDLIGWLKIADTVIDYPVMQTLTDESYYLNKDFHKEENVNGSLILDTDSIMGIGCKDNNYAEAGGIPPSTNLIIHGHTMKSGLMFGGLKKYAEESYGKEHSTICFDSLYEKREYEVIAVFYSQVYMSSDDVFKYYKFFQADSKDQFDDWYENIKEMSLYDTEVTAEYGDEFITLSCCSYQVADGRFVVVGKRIK